MSHEILVEAKGLLGATNAKHMVFLTTGFEFTHDGQS